LPGAFFSRSRETDGSPAKTTRSWLKPALVGGVLLALVCVAAAFVAPSAKRLLRDSLHGAKKMVAGPGVTGNGEGYVRRVKPHRTVSATLASADASKKSSAPAEDWSQFRGPGGMGHSAAKGLPLHWSPTENVTWKTPIPGKGWSSPVTFGDRIFVTTAVPAMGSQELHLLELDAASGEIEWDATVFDKLIPGFEGLHGKNSYATPTPLIADGRIYVHFGPNGTACLTLDGETVWKTRELKYDSMMGGAGSCALVDGILVINCDGVDKQVVLGLNADTGKVRWTAKRALSKEEQHYAFATPLVIDVNGKKQVVSPGAAEAHSLDPHTGAELWRVSYGGYSTVSRPVFGNGLVYLANGSPRLMAVRPDGHGDVTNSHVVWKQAKSIPHCPSPLLVGDSLFLIQDAGVATCLDALTGKPRWTHRVGGEFVASPIIGDGHIFAIDEQGTTTIFSADPKQYTEIAKNKLNEQCQASPAVIDNALLIRTVSALYRIENPTTSPRLTANGP